MTIDWITVSAQIVNFLILVWVLKRLLYQPVLDAMAAREQRMAERLDAAVVRERIAHEAAEDHRRARERLAEDRERILSEARSEAEQERSEAQALTRRELAEARAHWHEQLEAEKTEFLSRLRLQAMEAVSAMARRALADLADTDLEAHMIDLFERRLKELDTETRQALHGHGEPLQVVTAFALGDPSRKRLTQSIKASIGTDATVEFSRSAELVCGIELIAGGHRVGWNVGDFVDDLGERVEHMLSHSTSLSRSR